MNEFFVKNKSKPNQISDLHKKIHECIEHDRYTQSKHALERELERDIQIPDVLHVLKTGYHEKSKTSFDEIFESWKYAIRGQTLENLDIRIIITFSEDDMLIITVMHVM